MYDHHIYIVFLFLEKLGYEINQRNKTHPFVHSLKYIICKPNEKCDIRLTYTSSLDQTHENKLKLSDTTLASS